jgi:hypothetical protein
MRRLEVFRTRKLHGIHVCLINVLGPLSVVHVKLTQAAVYELLSTLHRVLQKRLCLHAYKLQVVQSIAPDDRVARNESAVIMLEKLDEDNF